MKKLIFIPIIIALLLALTVTSAFALDGDTDAIAAGAEEIHATDASENTEEAKAAEDTNIFSDVFSAILNHSGEILSAITALLSGIVIFIYKRGILPSLSGGISVVKGEVAEIEKHSKAQKESSLALSSTVSDGLASANERLTSLQENLTLLSERLILAEHTYKGTDELFSVLSSQLEMLYEIFMSSSLPAYEKERVAERIAAMKDCLTKKAEERENV